jgi:acyl-lipid omega-6 desaturase (Delta-12 desaturase)
MINSKTKELRAIVSEYRKRSTALALLLFGMDLLMYVLAVVGVILFENIALKILCSVLAGFNISALFIIGHDAAHNAFTNSKILNQVIARIVFLPSLHNYGLWLTEHNRIHHQATNIKDMDSWSPLSKEEYDSLPDWKKRLQRFYRTIPGICFYYMIERWWKNKFFPFNNIKGKYNSVRWDFLLVSLYLVSYLSLLTYIGQVSTHSSSIQLILLGFVLPFLIWNFMMGFTVYQHHTHETIAWNKSRKQREKFGGQEDFTMHVKYPHWYNMVSHNIMAHTAHHVDPSIPAYHLDKAQNRLSEYLGDEIKVIKFSFSGFIKTLAKCKLYDYDKRIWLDFNGKPTSTSFNIAEEATFSNAA